MITVRPLLASDLPDLEAIDVTVHGKRPPGEEGPAGWLGRSASRGHVWVIADGETPVGYAFIQPVPALSGVYELDGCITPRRQGQGLGTTLLRHVLSDVDGQTVRQLSHPVSSLGSPAAQLLLKEGFFVEHVEWWMVLDDVDRLADVRLPPDIAVRVYDRQRAAAEFRRLYEPIFAGLPWSQPYLSEEEVVDDMLEADEILFLVQGTETVGFSWLRWTAPREGQVEPIGIVKAHQGRGLGRCLLAASVQFLVRAGARRVGLGVWQNNRRAIHLYEQAGFWRKGLLTYLAYEMEQPRIPGAVGANPLTLS
jgi:mycothiol synthase